MTLISVLKQSWTQLPKKSDTVKRLAIEHKISDILAQLCILREPKNEGFSRYLDPKLATMRSPTLIKDLEVGVDIFLDLIAKNETIGLLGDYDVDGVTSTVIMIEFFKKIKFENYIVFMPNRFKDGYGLTKDAVKFFIDKNVSAVISMDCGSTFIDEIQMLKDNNIKTIILDHHTCLDTLPQADAMINPQRKDDVSGLQFLSAVGVVFYFLVHTNSILKRRNEGIDLEPLLVFVALGTLCDVVPLIEENRTFVKRGLKIMAGKPTVGLKKLLLKLNIFGNSITASDVMMRVGPKINATGRMDSAMISVELLTENNEGNAEELVEKMFALNEKRVRLEFDVMVDIKERIKTVKDEDKFMFLYDESWHKGLVGILASRTVELTKRPSFIGISDGEIIQGSVRSVAGIDVASVINELRENGLLIRGGGHKMAAGFSVKKSDERDVIKIIRQEIDRQLSTSKIEEMNFFDISIQADELMQISKELELLEPCGTKNLQPIFHITNIRLHSSTLISNKFLKAVFKTDSGKTFEALYFRNDNSNIIKTCIAQENFGSSIDIIGSWVPNSFRGKTVYQSIIHDIVWSNQSKA
ncbi:MAG: single-stranded-DNA-specific exonuclease RecJ [Alphaproteobacteria bacterium]|nr:single-stranded-DNA-specific exonuclease RecJ [Alphaproteobacteria bacterium]